MTEAQLARYEQYRRERFAHMSMSKDQYEELMRLLKLALEDTNPRDSEENYYLQWAVELCETRLPEAK